MLRPGPVKVAFALADAAGDGLAVLINGRKHLLAQLSVPAVGRTQNPLHFLVAADLDHRGLVARGDDDGVVRLVVVDGIHMRPVAPGARAGNVAEGVASPQALRAVRPTGSSRSARDRH